MRVPVMRGHSKERGAVAVIVACLSVALIGISAFTIDFGMAYVNKRQLQVASDAAALGAAAVFGNATGTCAAKVANADLVASAQATADSLRDQNRPSATGTMTASCTPDGKGVQVTYSSTGSTPSVTGKIFGQTSGYTPSQSATAVVGIPKGAVGVRPYALCASQLPSTYPSVVVQLALPSTGNTQCPGATSSGNWWEINCPEDAGDNSNSYLGTATANGCTSEIDVVPGQGTLTGSDLRNYLISKCPAATATTLSCLGANPGKVNGDPVITPWNTLVTNHAKIIFPAFCGGSPNGMCDQAAVINAGGNNAIYPVQSLVGVEICGYHFGNQDSSAIGMTGDCSGSTYNPSGYMPSQCITTCSQDNYLLVRVIKLQTSGGSSDFADCAMGAGCDTGTFAVHLTQ